MKKRNIIYPIIIAVLAGFLFVSHLSVPVIAQPGTASDPLVTQRYVDDLIADLQAQINALQGVQGGGGITTAERHEIINDVIQAVGSGQVIPFTPLFLPAGSNLVLSAGAEFILRSGSANVFAGPNGLVDVTAGRDIGNGQAVSRNHLMLVPATDGRRLSILTDSWLMIKGGFVVAN